LRIFFSLRSEYFRGYSALQRTGFWGEGQNQSGVVLVNSKNNGTVNLNFQSSTPTLTLNNGAIVFDVDGAKGYAVNLAGGTFTTSSSKPISGVSLDNIDEVIVDTEFDY
jgi:hypothetical protein